MTGRIRLLQVFFCLISVIVILRLGYWQIIKSPGLSRQAQLQYQSSSALPAPRGRILSADGHPLADNHLQFNLISDPMVLTRDFSLAIN